MDNNLYADFDEIFRACDEMLGYAERNIERLQKHVAENASVRKYGVSSLYGGYFCPSLILETTTSDFRKGRLLKNIPKGRGYALYELDSNGRLLRLQEIGGDQTLNESYVIEDGNTRHFLAMSGKKRCPWAASMRAIYEDGRLGQFDIVQGSSLWSERYEYGKDATTCRQYHYVPKLKGSDKSIPVGEKGSPARLFMMNFTMGENGRIDWLAQGEYIDGKAEMNFEYGKKKQK
ncbi:MAG: hypothetical protein LBI59_00055 [Candidatus Accumulibacter sp.]|jgi:hypothetical protein|nr:hypothetical protein [Accumulibacter sp.]